MEYLLPLKDRKEIAAGTMAFWFDTTGVDFSFKPGQWAEFLLIDPPYTDEEGNERDLSMASSPNMRDHIMIAMRMRKTAFKNSLKEMPIGTKVKVTKPRGSFVLHQDISRPAVFLAGGIGITPVRSIVEYKIEEDLPHKVIVIYSNRNRAETVFLEDFEKWAEEDKNLILAPTLTESFDPNWKYNFGRIDLEMIKKYAPDILSPIYYLSGPPDMVTSMWQMLNIAGVTDDNIRIEEFAGY